MNPDNCFTFTCPLKTNSGNIALENLPVELSGLNAGKPLLVTNIEKVGRKAVRTLTGAFGDSGTVLIRLSSQPANPEESGASTMHRRSLQPTVSHYL